MSQRYTFAESIELLEGLYRTPALPWRQVGLQREAFLLGQLGDPHRAFRSVHVTGSSGKGSTTSMIGCVLQAQGYRTGYFRSPHLQSYRERINLNGADITEEDWANAFSRVWPIVEGMANNQFPGYDLGRPTLFGVIFAMAAWYFREAAVQWAAVEVGLGGRWDATNLVASDVAVITNVSLEHTHLLGDTVAAIAGEKAAIIKAGCHAVTASEDRDALAVIEERASEVGAPLLRVGRDVQVRVESEHFQGQRVTMAGPKGAVTVSLPLAGTFQAMNAATAYAAVVALRERGVDISDESVISGLERVSVPGRFEIVSFDPLIVLDGAHHPAAVRELARTLERLAGTRRLVVLFAALADKDARAMASPLAPLAESIWVTRAPGTDRAADTLTLANVFRQMHVNVRAEDDADVALDKAVSELTAEHVLLVTGSLYLVGHVRQTLPARMAPT